MHGTQNVERTTSLVARTQMSPAMERAIGREASKRARRSAARTKAGLRRAAMIEHEASLGE